jgi:hypothetical protein
MFPAAAAPLCMECSQSRRAARLGAEIEHCRPYRGQPLVGVLLLGQLFQNDDDHEGDREDGRACLEDRAHLGHQSTTPRDVCNEKQQSESCSVRLAARDR